MERSQLDIMTSYVPALIARRLAVRPHLLTTPEVERFPAAVLLADISGFTSLAEQLARRGPVGAETVTHILNGYFGQLIDMVSSLGGDVLKFAGDAALAMWHAAELPGGLVEATHRAAQCSLSLQMILHNYDAEGVRLLMRMGISAGEIITASVGGWRGRWEFVVAGDPLAQVGAAAMRAAPGQVVLASSAHTLIRSDSLAQVLPDGSALIEDMLAPLPLRLPEAIAPVPEMAEALRNYIPEVALAGLDAGQTGWLAELRRVSALFLNVAGLDYTTPDSANRLQTLIYILQEILYHYEGSINQFLVDDKGSNLIAAFGLPTLSHEDDAARCIQAAQACCQTLKRLGLQAAAGIATGHIFCGARGNARRREYALIGDTVNLAARLMQATSQLYPADNQGWRILCDAMTAEAAAGQIEFEALPPVMVKGKAQAVNVFQPCPKKHTPPFLVKSRPPIVGRQAERALLTEYLSRLASGAGSVILIEGEAGIGKTRLVEELQRQTTALGMGFLLGAGDAVDRSAPYHAWRGVFGQLFDLLVLATPKAQQRHFLNLLKGNPEMTRLAPLLNPVLPFTLPDNDLTDSMTGQVRADNTRNLMIRLLQDLAFHSPTVIVLEDAHWLDSASWALALAVSQLEARSMLLIATRPLAEPAPFEYQQLLQSPGAQRLRLDTLPAEETVRLVCQRLQVEALPQAVIDLILDKAEGQPFFSEELASALRDAGYILIEPGEGPLARCRLAPGVAWGSISFPDTVQAVILSRIDRLSPQQQLTLKVASVIGRVFAYQTLYEIHPIESDKTHLRDYLENLQRLDITPLETPEPDLSYIFKHMITQEVAYNLMSFEQRQQLHQALGDWYERTHAADLSPSYSLLAHHYHYANNVVCEQRYARLAGEQAAAHFANAEAVAYLSRALELTPESDRAERYAIVQARERVYDLTGARGQQQEDLALLARLADALSDDAARAEVALRQAHYNTTTGDYATAITWLQTALDLAQALSSARLQATGYFQWGHTLWRQGEYASAQSQLERALAIAQAGQMDWLEAYSLSTLGNVLADLGDNAAARRCYEQALELHRRLSDRRGESMLLNNLGNISLDQGDYVQAHREYEHALRTKRTIGDRLGEGYALANLGNVALYLGEYTQAETAFGQALAIFRQVDARRAQGLCLVSLGLLYHHLGRPGEAETYSRQALQIAETLGDHPSQGNAWTNIGHAMLGQGQLDQAQAAYQQALALRQEAHQTHMAMEAIAGLARVAMARAGRSDGTETSREMAQAYSYADQIVRYLEDGSLEGADDPFQVYLTCYCVLAAAGDARAAGVLAAAHQLLQAQAARINDTELRHVFLRDIQAHREMVAAFSEDNSEMIQ